MVKSGLKRCFQWYCAGFGPHRKAPAQARLLVLMYHRILARADKRSNLEEPGMVVTPETFRMHMQQIRKYFSPIQLCDWVSSCATRSNPPGLYCAVTFDDGWADNHENALPILQQFDMPATIFLATNLIGTDSMFWPERLSRLLTAIALTGPDKLTLPDAMWLRELLPSSNYCQDNRPTSEQLAAVISKAKSYSDDWINQRVTETTAALGLSIESDQPSLLNWEQVRDMLGTGLVDIASHTRHHVRLHNGLPQEVLEHEIVGSKNAIWENTGHTARAFCFPNGDYSSRAINLVRQHYQCAVSTETGWNDCQDNVYLLRRIGIHNDTTSDRTAFLARISGWM